MINICKEFINRFVTKHKLLSSIILCLVFFAVFFSVNGFHIYYSTNDDLAVSYCINNGDKAVTFVGYFATAFSIFFQQFLGNFNSYAILLELLSFISLVAVNYGFLSLTSCKKGLIILLCFNVIFASVFLVQVQFTHTSVITACGGILCLLCASYEKRKFCRIIQIVIGFILLFFSSQIRFTSFLIILLVLAVFAVSYVFIRALNKKGSFKYTLINSIKKYLKAAILMIIATVTVFGFNIVSESIKNNLDGYKDFYEYNDVLSSITDYETPYFNYDPEFYTSIGIDSQNDLQTIKFWYVDDDFFTYDKLEKISSYTKLNYSKDTVINNSYKRIKYIIMSGLIILLVFVYIFSAFFMFILWYFNRGKNKRFWPLFTFIILWSLFYLYFGYIETFNIISIPLIVVCVISALFCNKYHNILCVILSLLFMALYYYLNFTRINFRSALSIFVPVFILTLLSYRSEFFNNNIFGKNTLNRALNTSIVALLLISSLTGILIFNYQVSYNNYPDNNDIIEYINDNQSAMFCGRFPPFDDKSNPFLLPENHKNCVSFGGWSKKSISYQNSMKKSGIKHLFKEISDGQMYIFELKEQSIGILECYLNEHYASYGETISLKTVKQFNNYNVYKVVSNNK